MIYMWQEERGKPYYRFQTEDKKTADKMKRRNKFKLVGIGFNTNLWIFQATFTRPDIAKKALKTLSGNKVKFNQEEEIFYSETNTSNEEKKAA